MKLKYKIWLDNDGKAFGEGPYQLLIGVKSTGSLAQAAKELNMSYSRAHGLMKYLNHQLGFALIESQAGGLGGGGTRVTAQAEDLMGHYEAFIRESGQALQQIFARHFSGYLLETPALTPEPVEKAETEQNETTPSPPELPVTLHPLQLLGRDVVALTGGGGKTSIMYALAEELSAGGAKVLITTTTRIMLPEHGAVNRLIIAAEQGITAQLRRGLAPKEIVALGNGVHEGKLMGLRPEFVDEIAALQLADYILVEADGAAKKPFKAPAEHEPAIPASSTVVLNIAGLDALDMPLDEAHCHRVERVCALTGLKIGQPLNAEAIATVMFSAEGGRKQVPRGAHWLPVINKIDNEADLHKAKRLAQSLVKAGAQDVVFASALYHKLKVVLWSKNL